MCVYDGWQHTWAIVVRCLLADCVKSVCKVLKERIRLSIISFDRLFRGTELHPLLPVCTLAIKLQREKGLGRVKRNF